MAQCESTNVAGAAKKRVKRVTGSSCCVPECWNSYGKDNELSFHDFPADKSLRAQWLHSIRRVIRPSFTESTKVCGAHFLPTDYKAPSERALKRREKEGKGGKPKKLLLDSAVPSVFCFSPCTTRTAPRKPPPKRRLSTSSSSAPEEDISDGEAAEFNPTFDDVKKENSVLREENAKLQAENVMLRTRLDAAVNDCARERSKSTLLADQLTCAQEQIRPGTFCISRFSDKASMVRIFTGFTSIAMFMACLNFFLPDAETMHTWQGGRTKVDAARTSAKPGPKPKLPLEHQFFVVCVRLRTGQTLDELEDRFGVDSSTLSRYFASWINLMYFKFKELLVFPSRRRVDRNMPQCFKTYYPSTRIIIDCTEFFVERPSSLSEQSAGFSNYKNYTTVKSLVGISPDGAFTFVSPLFEGSISDRDIVIESDLLPSLQFGDSVMADKGFNIQDLLAPYGVRLNIPPFNTKAHQMLPKDVITTKTIASVRIHVERAIKRIKEFRLLGGVIDNNLYDLLEQTIFTACMLCNFQPALVAR